MSREVVTKQDLAKVKAEAAGEPEADQFKDRLMKYIPGEIVSLFILLDGLARNAPEGVSKGVIGWVVFVVLLVGTWFYLRRIQKVTKWQQLLISTAAFAVWVFYLGGPFDSFSWYNQFYGNLLLPVYTFGIALVEAKA